MDYAYLMSDKSWPPVLHSLRDKCPETGLLIVSPIDNPQRVLYVYQDDLWIMASIDANNHWTFKERK